MPDILDKFSFLTLPAAVYISLIFLGKHLPPQSEKNLSKWLRGKSETSWIMIYIDAVDGLFGENFLSYKRLFVVSTASVVSTIILWIAFDAMHSVMPERVAASEEIIKTVGVALIVNIIPDALSFQQTSVLLKKFGASQNFIYHVLILIADLACSSAISLLSIFLWAYLTTNSTIVPLEVLGGFTNYSVFFYSAFLTSFWAWIFCISLWVSRLSGFLWKKGLLDSKHKPIASISLIAAALMLIGTFLIPKLSLFTVKAEDFLCSKLLPNCGAAYEERSVEALLHLCVGKSRAQCYVEITTYFDRINRPELAEKLILNGCSQGKELYCIIAFIAPGQTESQRRLFAEKSGLICSNNTQETDKYCLSDSTFDDVLGSVSKFKQTTWPREPVHCSLKIDWALGVDSLDQIRAKLTQDANRLDEEHNRLDEELKRIEEEGNRIVEEVKRLKKEGARLIVEAEHAIQGGTSSLNSVDLLDQLRANTDNFGDNVAQLASNKEQWWINRTQMKANQNQLGFNLECQVEATVRAIIYGIIQPPDTETGIRFHTQ